jgi:hypothetical protein
LLSLPTQAPKGTMLGLAHAKTKPAMPSHATYGRAHSALMRVVSYCHPADSGIPRLAGCKVRSPVRDDGAKCAICRNEGDSTCFEGAAYAGSGVGDAAIHVL